MKFHTAFAAAALALAASPALAARTYTIDAVHSEVGFRVRHFFARAAGRFNAFEGNIVVDDDKPEASSVAFKIDVTSIDTGNADRDKHLRSADFFDVAKYPHITFQSTKVAKAGPDTWSVTGNLTMHGVTKEITLPVKWLGETAAPWGGYRGGFETSTTLQRKDFNITWNKTLDSGGVVLGEEVEVTISLEVDRKAEGQAPAAPAKK